jgi:hypothetical protein
MLLYVRATLRVLSIVIVVERIEEGNELLVQRPVYYLSKMLILSKQNYLHYQKVAYGVYMAARKPKHYFEEHPIMVVSTTTLSESIGCKDATGRVAKWAIELAACRCSGYRGIPVHLLLGSFNGPASAQG